MVVLQDMILQRILANDEEKLSVVAGVQVVDNWEESPDILDSHRLGVEVGDRCCRMEVRAMEVARIGDVVGLLIREGVDVAIRRIGSGVLLGGAGEAVAGVLVRSLTIEGGRPGFGFGGSDALQSNLTCGLTSGRTRSAFVGLSLGVGGRLYLGIGGSLGLGIGSGRRLGGEGSGPRHCSAIGTGARGGTGATERARGRNR